MSPLGLLLNVSSLPLDSFLTYYNNTFQLLTSVLVALLYPIVTSTSFLYLKAVKHSNIKAVRPPEVVNTWRLISSQLNSEISAFLKSNGV